MKNKVSVDYEPFNDAMQETVQYLLYYLLVLEPESIARKDLCVELNKVELPILSILDICNDKGIIVFFNGNYLQQRKWEAVLFNCLKGRNIRCGVSGWDNNPAHIPMHKKYAQIAAQYGNSSTDEILRYEKALLPLLKDLVNNEVFYSDLPSLQYLKEWDRINSSHHYDYLRTCLYNQMNLSETARKMEVSRTTVQRHLNKVEQILNMNLDDAETRLVLMLSVFLEQNERQIAL